MRAVGDYRHQLKKHPILKLSYTILIGNNCKTQLIYFLSWLHNPKFLGRIWKKIMLKNVLKKLPVFIENHISDDLKKSAEKRQKVI